MRIELNELFLHELEFCGEISAKLGCLRQVNKLSTWFTKYYEILFQINEREDNNNWLFIPPGPTKAVYSSQNDWLFALFLFFVGLKNTGQR